MGTQLKRNTIDARYLRTRKVPRTRIERAPMTPDPAHTMRKTHTNTVLIVGIAAMLVVALAGISMLPNLLFASPGPNTGESAAPAATATQDTKDEASRLKELIDSTDSDLLTLVNKWNAAPEDRKARLVEIENGQKVDERCKDDLEAMLRACRKDGNSPMICSAYRTKAEQQELLDAEVEQYEGVGYSRKYAIKRAGKSVASPGFSEHHLGLAIDVVDELNQRLDSTQITSDTQKWMMENSWKYGFILRYPSGKEDITGIVFEPWHYRYLTRDVAREVNKSGLCYEEFLDKVRK